MQCFVQLFMDPLGCEVEIDDESLPGTIVEWVRRQPDALTCQFVLRAEVEAANAQTRLVLAELTAVKRSQTWRTGKLVLFPVGLVRRIFHRR